MICLIISAVFGLASAGLILPGGKMVVQDLNRADIQDMAMFAISHYNMKMNTAETLDSVVSAATQVVSGMNYFLTVDMADSGVVNMRCDFTVWYQSWTKVKLVTKEHCYKHMTRAGMVGQQVNTMVTPAVMAAAEFATTALNAKTNSLFRDALVTVDHVTEQVVSGMLYRMTITIGQTSCRNNGMTMDGCAVATNAMTKTCQVTVWEQAWMNPSMKLTESHCM